MTNNKRKTTSKDVKTLLFASLIVAMILPFSGMNYADGVTDEKQSKLATKLEHKQKQLEEKRKYNNFSNEEIKKIKEEIKHIEESLEYQQAQISTTNTLIEQTDAYLATLDENSLKYDKVAGKFEQLKQRLDKQLELDDEQQVIAGYDIKDIAKAFGVTKPYTEIVDAHIVFDAKSAKVDPKVSLLDIEITNDYIIISNKMIDQAFIGQTNQTLIDDAMESYEAGKFHSLFDNRGKDIHSTMYEKTDSDSIVYTVYEYVSSPIISAFGISQEADITNVAEWWWSLEACGGGHNNPHNDDTNPSKFTGFSTLAEAQTDLAQNNYHNVPAYASWQGDTSRPYDWAKVVSSGAPGGCNNGPFRDQGIIDKNTFDYNVYEDEPNPEVLSYWWPAIWWYDYVVWWHQNF